jgi:dGTPase
MFYTRQILEDIEDRILAPYAIRSKNSKGRAYQENEAEYRTAFQRDRDRILHTTAFRRLEYKTQVFINHEGDYYRTRLTHSLEVAQIGRTIARALGANEDLVEVICLAHDMGHPPFGHSGERVLNILMDNYGGFDHNRQTLRIVSELEQRYPNFPGLNLTWETREGIVKHETEYDISDASGYDPHLRGHLEAQITNAADELAYIAHDLDDGLHSEMISTQDLSKITIWERLLESIGWDVCSCQIDELTLHRLIRRFVGWLVDDMIRNTEERLKESHVSSVLELQQLPYDVIGFGEEMAAFCHEMKDFLYKNLYRHYRVKRVAVKTERILSDLFNTYMGEPAILPKHIRNRFSERPQERVICDYIAGMTDRFAIQEHHRIFDPDTRV